MSAKPKQPATPPTALASAQPAAPAPPAQQIDAGLEIRHVRLQDFRGLNDLCVSLDALTVLVGENNAGKSSVLQALGIFFGTIRPGKDDLHISTGGNQSTSFVVDVCVVPASGGKFGTAVAQRLRQALRFADAAVDTDYFAMRCTGTVAQDGSGVVLRRQLLSGWDGTRAGAAKLAALPDNTQPILELFSFFLLDARRDIVEDLRQRSSAWGRLLSDLSIPDVQRQALEASLSALGDQIVASSPILAGLKTSLVGLQSTLSASVADVALAPLPGRIDEIVKAVDVMLTTQSGAALPIRMHGQGARSIASVMVFQAFIKHRSGLDSSKSFKPHVLVGFEEPEAHLHPQAHRAMFDVLKSLNVQTVISTHSPYVARDADVHCIRRLARATAASCVCSSVPRRSNGAPTFSPDDLVKVRKFVQRNNGETFFASVVILVEGDTEDLALPVFARAFWSQDPASRGISIARSDGSKTGKHIARILEYLKIPWVLFADGDAGGLQGRAGIEAALQRPLVDDVEVFALPSGADFEQYLVDVGYEPVLSETVKACFGQTAMDDLLVQHGTAYTSKRPTDLRDYKATGWEGRLVRDHCRRVKGWFGEGLAEGIVERAASHGLPPIPPKISDLFTRVSKM